MEDLYRYEKYRSGYMLSAEKKRICIDRVIESIKNELPEEAQTVEILSILLDDIKEQITQTRLLL